MKTAPLFELCGAADDINDNYFLFPNKFSARFYEVRTKVIFYLTLIVLGWGVEKFKI